MKVRVQLTVDVSDTDRRHIASHMNKRNGVVGSARFATLAEIREFFRVYGVEIGRQVLDKTQELHESKLQQVA